MNVGFEKMESRHGKEITDIFNFYIRHSYAAYPSESVDSDFIQVFLKMTESYPAYAITEEGRTVGFCFLQPFHPASTFRHTALISYFISPESCGKGLGTMALGKLEGDARKMGVQILLASIASENGGSLTFHRKHGFRQCGRFEGIIRKNGKEFDVVWMQKNIG